MSGASLRALGHYALIRAGRRLGRLVAGPAPASAVWPLEKVAAAPATPLGLSRLLEGRSNPEREAAVAWYLAQLGVPVHRQAVASFEGPTANFAVDLGSGDRVLVLAAHHDAVPGSPGANDNAAAVGILLALLPRLERLCPPRFRVRLLFPGAEEQGYVGAAAYVRDRRLDDIVGVLSLELCGIGDTIAIWDAERPTPFTHQVAAALAALGRRPDEGYHVVGRIPAFGSDHRPFAAAGVPAHGLTLVPAAEAEALRRFVLSPVAGALLHLRRRPRPFDTYHTARDTGATLEAAAVEAATEALEAVVSSLG